MTTPDPFPEPTRLGSVHAARPPAPLEQADGLLDTLPSRALRGARVLCILQGILCGIAAIYAMFEGRGGWVILSLPVLLPTVLAAGSFIGSRAIHGAMWATVVGLIACALSGLLWLSTLAMSAFASGSVVAPLAGALGVLFAGAAGLLLAITIGEVMKIGRARRMLRLR